MLMDTWAGEVIVYHQLHGWDKVWLSVAYFHLPFNACDVY